ncbi:MAG: hypothetical protein K6G55_08845 [Selenomonadaceae bacterium]|nr:hypothetical protein [Selenomonadaceae bacterium]
MNGKKFAFESPEISIAFSIIYGLGDAIMIKKVFNALIELAPDCVIDIFGGTENHMAFAKSFYCDSKNLNNIYLRNHKYNDVKNKYDLALLVHGNHYILFDYINSDRLKIMSPNLFKAILKVQKYNQKHVYYSGVNIYTDFYNMVSSRIVNKKSIELLSCDGALPIYDDKITLPLLPEHKSKFDALKLDKYIAIYSDCNVKEKIFKAKIWPIKYFVEYVSMIRRRFPDVEIIQVGGESDIKIENADRHLLSYDLELTKYLLANALLLVGCESGYVHMATALETKCLVLFGFSNVDYFGYDRNINIVSEVCSPCMYATGSSSCMRGKKHPPCMYSITPQRVCEATCNYLNECGIQS